MLCRRGSLAFRCQGDRRHAGRRLLIIFSAILTTLIVWLLVATGVSVNLLVSLAAKPGPVEIDSWLADYGDGFGVDDLFRDRLNLLCSTGAATVDQSAVSLVEGIADSGGHSRHRDASTSISKPTAR